VRFILYSEKTVTQCLTAINARMHVKGTASRPTLDGWVEKNGAFSISMSAPVIGKFTRRTVLKAKVERENGITTIRGSVPHGVSREGQAIIFVALAIVAVIIITEGNALFGFLLIPFAAYLYIPLHGDHLNSALLIDEVQKTLKAKPKPPKKTTGETKPAASKSVTRSAGAATRATTTRSTTTRAATAKATSAPKLPTAAKPPAAQRILPAPKQAGFDDEFPPQEDDE
jgi:hypothetical protein